MEKISVTVIVLNEERNIRECLESFRWADEVIVSDSGSTDATVEICKGYGAKIFKDEWLGFGRQKNLCAGRATNNWILNVDADERVTPGLKDEITRAIGSGDGAGYYIPRRNYFGQKWIRRCGWYPDYALRLYRKDAGRFLERGVHESVVMDGTKAGSLLLGYLKNPLIHKTYRDVSDYLVRMERYSTLAAEEMMKEGKTAGVLDILLRPPFTFFKMFVLKLGFLDGVAGITLSILYASYTLAKYAKLWEMGRGGWGSGE
ncbi:MAG: glycosyltransferase family 2 protein [Deltaproteobacteria bacterium]|nr:glycosyltransferase family 2 protein [Deltaproteobacteria bacterium]